MDPISNADRLVRLLRQRLEERSKAKSTRPTGGATEVHARSVDATKAITGRQAKAGGSNKELRRTLIEQLLADQFGPALVNEAKFQQMVDNVASAMEADAGISGLLEEVLVELKKQA